jgi:hypothetical protein
VQEGNRLHYLADRASITGQFSDADLRHLDQAFPLLLKQLELMLTSGELNPRHQHCVTLYAKGLTCEADSSARMVTYIWRFIRHLQQPRKPSHFPSFYPSTKRSHYANPTTILNAGGFATPVTGGDLAAASEPPAGSSLRSDA